MNAKTFANKLRNDRFAIISAPADRFGRLVTDMVNLQQQTSHVGPLVLLDGKYDGQFEKSILVFGVSAGMAHCKGQEYNQECVLHSDFGFIYTDHGQGIWFDKDSETPVVGRTYDDQVEVVDLTFDIRETDEDNISFARFKDGGVVFSLGLDF